MKDKFEHRYGTIGVVLGMLAVLALCAGLVLFVLDTRSTARTSQQVAIQAVESEKRLRELITSRCEQRAAYDQRFVRAAEGDAKFYEDLLALAKRVDAARTEPLPPAMQKLVDEQEQLIADALSRKQAIVAEGIIGGCEAYNRITTPDTPGAPSLQSLP